MYKAKKDIPTFSLANIARFIYYINNLLIFSLEKILFNVILDSDPKKICIYRIGNIGDIICCIPIFKAIRVKYPNSKITLLTSPGAMGSLGAKELLDNGQVNYLDEMIVYYSDEISTIGEINGFSKSIRRLDFDAWITISVGLWGIKTIIRNMFFVKFCGVKNAIGFKYSTLQSITKEQIEYLKFENEVNRSFNMLNSYGLNLSSEVEFDLPVKKCNVDALFDDYKVNNRIIIGFVPGAKRVENRWPIEYWVTLANSLADKYTNLCIIIIGGPDDNAFGDEISNQSKANIVNFCGKTSLIDMNYLILKLDLLISNNTGPMHISAQYNKNVIGLFSSAELDGKWFPYGKNAYPIMKRIECEGCYYGCENNFQCMKNITVSDVLDTIKYNCNEL